MIATLIAVAAPAAAATVLPLSTAATGHVTVPVTIDGLGPQAFVFDTGAEGTVLYQPAASAWGLPVSTDGDTVTGQTGTMAVSSAALPPLSLGPIRRTGLKPAILPPRVDGVLLAGIVGLDVFGDGIVTFDLPAHTVTLLPDVPLRLSRVPAVPVRRTAGRLLTVAVRIGGTDAIAVIDTGARKTRINWALGRAIGLSAAALPPGDSISGATAVAFQTRAATVGPVTLGGIDLGRRPALVGDLPVFAHFGVGDRPAVILGLDWLTSVRMTIDFSADRLWLEPNRS